MPGPDQTIRYSRSVAAPAHSEQPFWTGAGALWRRLAGGFANEGFSFEWHDWDAGSAPLPWAKSFHGQSVELCLNLQGSGWVACEGARMDLSAGAIGFFALNGGDVKAERSGGEHHQFLSVEYSIPFLRNRLSEHSGSLHPVIRGCLNEGKGFAGTSAVSWLTHRHHELLNSLLHPPVLAAAQRLWYEVKALEFAAEFFFTTGEGEPLCTRAKRLAAERVARAKQILLVDLANPPSLEELGRRVGCSHFYLSRTFTVETGLTISQWLRRARLQRAAELLQSGKWNVTQTALEVGYSSLSHFSEAFHEMFGCCPGLYPLRTSTQRQGGR